MCVCVCMYARRHVQIDVNAISVCVRVLVYVCTLRPELDIRNIFQLLSSSFVEKVSLTRT